MVLGAPLDRCLWHTGCTQRSWKRLRSRGELVTRLLPAQLAAQVAADSFKSYWWDAVRMIHAQGLLEKTSAVGLTFLKDVKVLDLTTSIAGPYAMQLLADLGATVVKVERPPGGDDCRAWGSRFWTASRFGSWR